MRKVIICILLISFNLSASDECLKLNRNVNTRSNSVIAHKCDGLKELKKKDFKKAVDHFLKGLAVNLFEVPNYGLKLELGETYCKMGKRKMESLS